MASKRSLVSFDLEKKVENWLNDHQVERDCNSDQSFPEVKEVVEKWWHNLQVERKCNSTNLVQKIVKNSSPEIQEQTRHVIALEIKKIIEKCILTKNIKDLQCACNAINGCFDNFVHAVDAIRLLFSEVISFIDFGLAECQEFQLSVRLNQKNAVLELLHSLSRILILVLKLKRTQNLGKVKNSNSKDECGIEDLPNRENLKCLLSSLTHKVGRFLMMDDILIDTKNNLSMSVILIREILNPDEKELIQFHKNFVHSIPSVLSDDSFKVNILKFLMSSAIINTWSVNIIDSYSTSTYLRFFISLCEKYSSETPIVLNTSRTLLLLIKHDSFKIFVTTASGEQFEQIISLLLSCIFMLLEHPVPCVRNSAKDFFQLLAAHSSIHSIMIEIVFKLPTDKRSYFISVGALAKEIGTEVLIENNPDLATKMIAALGDPTIVSHVSLALEYVILNDGLAEKNFSKWCETWVVPLLISLMNVLPIVAADIEKLLEKAFKKYPESLIYVIDRWSNPTSEEELRYIITALKICQKQGFKLKKNSLNGKAEENEDTGKDLISENLLEHCLHQRDDDIRISAFSLIIEAHKSTKAYSDVDFKLILYFLKYNLNNQKPSTRQKILGLVRKMLVRFSESRATFSKTTKNETEQIEKLINFLMYGKFIHSLTSFCFSNIFAGCNFNRLNTVLNILLLCFENIKDMNFNREEIEFYWSNFLTALGSSYEENKALAVVIANKIDLCLLHSKRPNDARLLYEKAFDLCTHMEPPDVLTGSYLLQALMKLPSSKNILTTYFVNKCVLDDVCYYCVQILLETLKEQVQLAKLDLMTAATCGPMYGTLFAIRLIFKSVELSQNMDQPSVYVEWGRILNELVHLSFEMIEIVGCVVNSSSPEGHLPMDFQTNFENLLSRNLNKKCSLKGSGNSLQSLETDLTDRLIDAICDNFFKKCNNLKSKTGYSDSETLRCVNRLLKENQSLIREIQAVCDRKCDSQLHITNTREYTLLKELKEMRISLKNHAERLQQTNTVVEWPDTAQVLLLCAWRSIKEASLFLGDLVSKLPLETEIEVGLVSKDTIVRIGEKLKTLLCEIKHRGAFEQAYIGFTQLVNSLWKCSDKNLNELPKQWLEDITNQLQSPLSDQKVKLCSTRRSAGLPFLVQAIICSEMVSIKSTTPSSLHTTMKSLLKITESGVAHNPEAKIHALNVLRALFKHAQLGEHVASYVSKALIVAIRGSRADTWSERNSSSLLFSSLIIRIFGVSRSREEISKKNRMTSRTFFQRYSELYDFLLSEMDLVYSKENYVDGLYPKPSLYLVLLILGRLYPPPTEDPDNIDLSEFLPYINMSRKNPTMKIRELGARALVPLIPLDRLIDEIDNRFSELSSQSDVNNNEKHGILLQIKELLSQSPEAFENLSKGFLDKREIKWMEKTKWILEQPKQTPLVVLSSYVKVLHILYKIFPTSREKISEIITNTNAPETLSKLNSEKQNLLGIYLFLENFYFLKTDVLACQWMLADDASNRETFFDLFMFMLKCKVSEVQSIPLRILRNVLQSDFVYNYDDDDFNGITAPVTDLLLFKSKESVRKLKTEFLNNSNVLKFLTEGVNSNSDEVFKSTVIQRIWLTVVSTFVLNGVIPVSRLSSSGSDLSIEFAKSLIHSGDKDLSTSALVCYALCLMEEVSVQEVSTQSGVLLDMLNEFSCSEADIKHRLAVAKIMNRCCDNFTKKQRIKDPVILSIWMIPFKLILDEDPDVRAVAGEFVNKMQVHVLKEIPPEKIIIKMKTLDFPHLPLVSLKAQECLLDCYVNILGSDNLLCLLTQMLVMALSSWCDPDCCSEDDFGAFEKGNPNPYCEDLALSNLMCQKLTELSSIVNLEALLRDNLNDSLRNFIAESLHLSEFIPKSLMEAIETVTTVTMDKSKKNLNKLSRIQIENLSKALNLPPIIDT